MITLPTMQLRLEYILTKTPCADGRRETEGQTHRNVRPVGATEYRNKDSSKS